MKRQRVSERHRESKQSKGERDRDGKPFALLTYLSEVWALKFLQNKDKLNHKSALVYLVNGCWGKYYNKTRTN